MLVKRKIQLLIHQAQLQQQEGAQRAPLVVLHRQKTEAAYKQPILVFWTTGTWGTGVRASKGGYTNYFEINWATQNNTSITTKTIAVDDFTFLQGSSTFTNSTSQTLSVVGFSSNQLSGGFTIAVSGGTITTITGGFNAINKK